MRCQQKSIFALTAEKKSVRIRLSWKRIRIMFHSDNVFAAICSGRPDDPPERRPEEEDGFDLKTWEHWEKQQEEAVEWFVVEDEE